VRVRAALAAALALALLAPASALAVERVSLTEMESQVMCPICGTLLQLAESPQAQREKAFIARLIAEGKSEGEIKAALVNQYGDTVLALPKGSGFSLSAYLVPIVAFVVAVIALALGVARWRRAGAEDEATRGDPEVEAPSGEEAERLEADLARYDL
jgi:cytochrome c-type biogenesis protein CcmH/NrfF